MALRSKRLEDLRALGGVVRAAPGVLKTEDTVQKLLGIPTDHPDAVETRQRLLTSLVQAAQGVPELVEEIDSLKAILREIEWNGDEEGDYSCPLCGGRKPTHRLECRMGEALKR